MTAAISPQDTAEEPWGRQETCPHCTANLQGDPIPDQFRRTGYLWTTGEGPTHYSVAIGIEVQGVYDGVLFWQCPFCKGSWHRFPPEHYLHTRAAKYVGASTT